MKLSSRALVLDLSTAPLPNAAEFVDADSIALGNRKDPDKIAAYRAEVLADRIAHAALDLDLARITGIGVLSVETGELRIDLCRTEDDERAAIETLAVQMRDRTLISYNGKAFDWPLLMRRARYLGIRPVPYISVDRYKSSNHDLLEFLSDRNPQRMRPLGFYVRRLGWTDLVKPLSGAEEANVPLTGDWDGLRASLEHDVTACYRLAQWLGVVSVADPLPLEQVS